VGAVKRKPDLLSEGPVFGRPSRTPILVPGRINKFLPPPASCDLWFPAMKLDPTDYLLWNCRPTCWQCALINFA
jgi:hypothetical protein